MEFVYDYNDAALRQALERAPDGITGALVERLRSVGQKAEHLIKGTLLTGEVLNRRTGMGQRSIFYRVVDDPGGNAIALYVGANLAVAPYMRIHALGGTIRPKSGRYLAIPLDAAKTASGVARFSAREVIEDPASFGFSGTFFRNGILFGSRYKRAKVDGQSVQVEGGKVVPLFALKTSVQIPQNNYLAIARHRLDRDITQAVTGAIDAGLEGASR